jgi:hypothetical protein
MKIVLRLASGENVLKENVNVLGGTQEICAILWNWN